MEKKKQMRSQRDLQYKKTRNTNKVSRVQNVDKPHSRGVGGVKNTGTKWRTATVICTPDGPRQYPRYTQVEKDMIAKAKKRREETMPKEYSDWPARSLWFVLGVLVGGSVVYAMARLALGGLR